MSERYADLTRLIEISSNLEIFEVVLNISYHEADDLNPFWVRDDICDLSRLPCAAEIPKVSPSARLPISWWRTAKQLRCHFLNEYMNCYPHRNFSA